MITKEEVREMLSVMGSDECTIILSTYDHRKKIEETEKFTNSDKALKWLVDEVNNKHKLMITIL